jgi:hypothetical protein
VSPWTDFSFAVALALLFLFGASSISAAPCRLTSAQQQLWVTRSVNDLVRTARATYQNENARGQYERVVNGIANNIKECQLQTDKGDLDFANRYPEFIEYVRLLSMSLRADRELGFEVSDGTYFAETSQYTTIPDFLLAPAFLSSVSRFESLPKAKAFLREVNAGRAEGDQLIFFSYQSRHLGAPDNPDSLRRLLIVVPGNAAEKVPEKWVQFGVPDPRAPASVRNTSVVAVLPGPDQTTNVYFKDYYRTYRLDGSITIMGRWELGEGDNSCVECHKSGVLPIFPVKGSVSPEEQPLVEAVNERFLGYGPARFDKYLDINKFGPGLGSTRPGESGVHQLNTESCISCHHARGLGALNWPMDSKLISSFVKGGRMPEGSDLRPSQRAQLYRQLIRDYFAIDDARPGILKAWLLGKLR